MTNWLTGIGYALSIVSVALLAWVAWPQPGEDSALIWAVMAGAVLSVVGMALRWAAHVLVNRQVKDAASE